MRLSKAFLAVIVPVSFATNCLSRGDISDREPRFDRPRVSHDPRTHFVLFSWTMPEGILRFALMREEQRNAFLDHCDEARKHGIDLATLEEKLNRLPKPALVEWHYQNSLRLFLPSPSVIHRIQ